MSEQSIVYGIRRYSRGAKLWEHTDRLPTHIISAIFQIDQKVDEDWPLRILDHKRNVHMVTMEPGEMVLYESATVLHGRPLPLKGEFYDNLFVHFKPVDLFPEAFYEEEDNF